MAAAQAEESKLSSPVSLLEREVGSGLPLWRSRDNLVTFDGAPLGPVVSTAVPGVAGAFVLSNILSRYECDQLRQASQAMGYLPESSSAGRSTRSGSQCVWIADDTLWRPIWERLAPWMPTIADSPAEAGEGRSAVAINQRWRCYQYAQDDNFSRHHDGMWLGSGLDDAGRFVRDMWGGRRQSELTVLLYLDDLDDYDGGATTFFEPDAEGAVLRSVRAPQGSALCFFHGQHPLSPLHEGSR